MSFNFKKQVAVAVKTGNTVTVTVIIIIPSKVQVTLIDNDVNQ